MVRRRTRNVTGIRGTGVVNASEVWRVFECFRPGCTRLLRISEDDVAEAASQSHGARVTCPKCGFKHDRAIIERGARWKYCRVCEWLQPLENFHKHRPTGSSFRSGRQLECKVCKNTRINPTLNPRRTADQHRESAHRRRLYSLLSGEAGHLESKRVFTRFDGRCFHCGRELHFRARGSKDFEIDHTLPVKYLWPVSTKTATLLCKDCNNLKHDRWPSDVYPKQRLRALSRLTSLPFDLLAGAPSLNPEAVARILVDVDSFIERWIAYPEDLKKIRRLLVELRDEDLKDHASTWPSFLDVE